MRHFAVLAPPFLSHVRALEALAGQLLARGHRVSWVHQCDVGPLLTDPRIEFRAVGATSHPEGSLSGTVARAARPSGPFGIGRVIRDVAAATDMLCREAPAVLKSRGVDAVIGDQMEAAGGLVADSLGLPFVSVACALPVNREPRVPLPVMPWGYAQEVRGEQLNEGSARVYDWLMRPHAKIIAGHAKAFGLRPRQTLAQCLSPLLQISQTTAAFDFKRMEAPPQFHHVGPLRPPVAHETALDLPLDDARPFVFASLGTLQGGRFDLFKRIARACRAIDVQLLLAHCNGLDAAQEDALRRSGASWVCGFAPQRAALGRADAVVSHAGLNTVLDAMAAGTPVVALPIAFDQPGVAARVVHAGVGLRLLPALASQSGLQRALKRVLIEPAFAQRASEVGQAASAVKGALLAADLVLRAVESGRPVTAQQVESHTHDLRWGALHAA